jgi:hypothetical protein
LKKPVFSLRPIPIANCKIKDNGDATNPVPFQSTERPACNGKILVIGKAKKDQKDNLL